VDLGLDLLFCFLKCDRCVIGGVCTTAVVFCVRSLVGLHNFVFFLLSLWMTLLGLLLFDIGKLTSNFVVGW